MSLELRPSPSRHRGWRERLSRHVWVVIVLIIIAAIVALCGRSASAQVSRGEEIIEKALALKPDPIEGGHLYRTLPPLTEPELGDGKQLALGGRIYNSVCAKCHRLQGEGYERSRTPALHGQHYSS